MQKLNAVGNELVPVYETESGDKVVYGKDLHKTLLVKTDFSTWAKRRLNECDAQENIDYDLLPKIEEQPSGAKRSIEYVIKLDTAKEMAMLERNEIGKQVRKYFIEIDNRYKQQIIDRRQLPVNMQIMYHMIDEQAQIVLTQQEQDKRMNRIEQKQNTMIETFTASTDEEDFKAWVHRCIGRIAESPKFDKGVGKNSNYAFARNESYDRLKKKWNCNLDDRVARAKGRALQRNPGISKTQLEAINKMTIIAADKSLRPVYETVIKEMMLAYCVDDKKC